MGLKLGVSRPVTAVPARSPMTRYADRQADLAELPAGALEVLTFLRLLAMVFEARQHLRYVVERRKKLEAQLADPALAEHPKRPQAERQLGERQDAERLATIALAEHQAHVAAQWDRIAPQEKYRYGLYTLIGEPDPAATIDVTLWRDDRPLNWLAPLPEDWAIPTGIAHLAYDPERKRFGVHTYDLDELIRSEAPSF